MTNDDLHELIVCIKRAALQDERQTRDELSEMKETLLADLTDRDRRDARLQHYMVAHNVPLENHMSAYNRNVENLNSLYRESFGCPRVYEQGRKHVEKTTLFQKRTR